MSSPCGLLCLGGLIRTLYVIKDYAVITYRPNRIVFSLSMKAFYLDSMDCNNRLFDHPFMATNMSLSIVPSSRDYSLEF